MARPMLLMKENLLDELYNKHKDGVKYNTLIAKYDLPVSGPTLKKLLKYYTVMQNSDIEVKRIIYASLFPKWLKEELQYQNAAKWVYIGTMPLGNWEEKEEYTA